MPENHKSLPWISAGYPLDEIRFVGNERRAPPLPDLIRWIFLPFHNIKHTYMAFLWIFCGFLYPIFDRFMKQHFFASSVWQRWEFMKENKKVRKQRNKKKRKKTRTRPRNRPRKKESFFLFFLDAVLVESVFSLVLSYNTPAAPQDPFSARITRGNFLGAPVRENGALRS